MFISKKTLTKTSYSFIRAYSIIYLDVTMRNGLALINLISLIIVLVVGVLACYEAAGLIMA